MTFNGAVDSLWGDVEQPGHFKDGHAFVEEFINAVCGVIPSPVGWWHGDNLACHPVSRNPSLHVELTTYVWCG